MGSHIAGGPSAPRARKEGKGDTRGAQKKHSAGGQSQSAEAHGTQCWKERKGERKGGAKKNRKGPKHWEGTHSSEGAKRKGQRQQER